MRDHGVRSLAICLAEAGFFQVPLVVEHLALTRRGDHPPDEVAASLSFLVPRRTDLVAAPPVCMELTASQVVADGEVVPSVVCVVPDPLGTVPAEPKPASLLRP